VTAALATAELKLVTRAGTALDHDPKNPLDDRNDHVFSVFSTNNPEFAMRFLNVITLLFVIIGGLNWGLVGLFDFDLVTAILGNGSAETATSSTAARAVYILVAASALYQIGSLIRLSSTHRAVVYR